MTDPAVSAKEESRSTHPASRLAFRLGLVILALAPLVYTIYKEWHELTLALQDIRWSLLLFSYFALLISMPLMAGIGWMVLHWFQAHLPLKKIFGIYFASQLPKYLPGGVWAFPGRVFLYRQAGLEGNLPIYAVVREVGALFMGAVLASAAGLLGSKTLAENAALKTAAIGGTLVCALMLLAVQVPAFWRWVGRFKWIKLEPVLRFMPLEPRYQSLGWFLPALAASLIFWLAMGLPFRWLAIAVNPQAASLSWLQHAAIFALAWVAGFVVVFSPAGLGIRETALSLLLSQWIPPGDALAVALLSRLCWIAAEAVLIAISLQWILPSRHRLA